MQHIRFIKIFHIFLHYSASAYIEISSALLCRSCYWIIRWHLVLMSRLYSNVGSVTSYTSRLLPSNLSGNTTKWLILHSLSVIQFLLQRLWFYRWCWYWWCHQGPLLKPWLLLIRLSQCCSRSVPMVTIVSFLLSFNNSGYVHQGTRFFRQVSFVSLIMFIIINNAEWCLDFS